MPVITFSLPQSSYDALASKALDDSESPNLVAKRLILGFLGDNNNLSLDESSKLLSRIESLESRLDGNLDESSKVLEKIKALESRLDDTLDGKGLDEAIANHPKFKRIEETLSELKDTFNDIYHRFYQESEESNVFVPLMTEKAENEYLNSEATENNPSEDSLEGGSKEIQVLEDVEGETPLEDPITEELPNAPLGDISETADIQGFQDDGGDDEVGEAIADRTEGLSDKELAVLLTKQGKKTTFSTVNRWRNGKTKPTGKNKNLFEEWEVKGDRWFPKS